MTFMLTNSMKDVIKTGTTRLGCSLIVFLFVASTMIGCQSASRSPIRTPKAIFIIVDGIPADVVESTATPYLDEISGANGYIRAYVGGIRGQESQSPTLSAVGYNSLITGTWSNKHNVWDNFVSDPNYDYWDIFRIAKSHDPSLQTALFSTWTDNRIKLVGDGLAAAGGKKLDYHFDGFENDTDNFPHDEEGKYIRDIDELVTNEATIYIKENGPDLSWIYLQYTDEVGHRFGDGPAMIEAVKLMDDQIGRIWTAVKNRERDYREDWLILVTTDHGRDKATGRGHGGQSDRERTIWIATNSRSLNPHFTQTPAIVDILPSLVTHLQLNIPKNIRDQLDGRSFID